MEENDANLDGIQWYQSSNGINFMPKENLKYKLRKNGKDWGNTGICFYEKESNETVYCKIHLYNPLTCHTFPFVVNLSTKFFMIKGSCKWMKKISKDFPRMLKMLIKSKISSKIIIKHWRSLMNALILIK